MIVDKEVGVAQQSQQRLLNIGEAAERLGVTTRFMRRMVFERRLPYIKVGKYVRFEPTDLRSRWAVLRVRLP